MKSIFSKIAPAAVALSFVFCLIPAPAMASNTADGKGQSDASSVIPTTTKTITWLATDEQPAFEDQIELEGITYTLKNKTVVEAGIVYPEVDKTATSWTECWPSSLQTTINGFEPTLYVDEEGYVGDIARISVEYEPIEATSSWEINQVVDISGLPDNDAVRVPGTYSFQNAETGNVLNLRLAGLTWSVEGDDTYTAHATYRGVDSMQVIDRYRVTATYAGKIRSAEPVKQYEATLVYEAQTQPETAELSQNRRSLIEAFSILPPLVGSAAVATSIIVFVYIRSRNVRFCRVDERGKLHTIARASARRAVDGALEVEMPVKVEAFGPGVVIVLPSAKADGSLFRVMCCGEVLFVGTAKELIAFA